MKIYNNFNDVLQNNTCEDKSVFNSVSRAKYIGPSDVAYSITDDVEAAEGPHKEAIFIVNRIDDNESYFYLQAELDNIISNINENYRSPDSEDDPEFLNSDLINYVEDWFSAELPGYKYQSGQDWAGTIRFEGDEPIPEDKLEKLANDLDSWVKGCYSYNWH